MGQFLLRNFKAFVWANEHYRFLIIGALNAIFGYLCFAVLYKLVGIYLHYLVIVILAHIIAVSNAFYLQRNLVFRTTGSVLFEFIRYNITTVGSLLVSLAGMSLLVGKIKMNVLLAQALLMVFMIITNYFVHKHFTFKKWEPKNLKLTTISEGKVRIHDANIKVDFFRDKMALFGVPRKILIPLIVIIMLFTGFFLLTERSINDWLFGIFYNYSSYYSYQN